MNNSTMSGKWTEIKGEIRKAWGKLTDDELEQTKGDAQAISGLVEQRYGIAKDDASNKVSGIFNRFSDKLEDAKDSLREKNERAQDEKTKKPYLS